MPDFVHDKIVLSLEAEKQLFTKFGTSSTLAVNAVLARLEASLESEITPATVLFTGFLVRRHRVHLQVVHRLKCLITFETLELPDNGVGPLSVELEGVFILEGSAADDTLVWFSYNHLGG